MAPRKRGRQPEGSTPVPTKQVKTNPEPEPVVVEEEEKKEIKDGKDTNEEEIRAELLSKPPHGSKVFIDRMPNHATKEELKEFCKDAGEIVEVKIARKKNSSQRHAFVTFKSVDMACKATKELHNAQFKVRCFLSHSRNTIRIENIPRNWEESELQNAIRQVGHGDIRVLLMKDSSTGYSRGYGYVEYYNYHCADYSLKKMLEPGFKLGTNSPTIRWADLRRSAVYVKNLPKDVTDEQIKGLFEGHGDIGKVVVPPPEAGYEKRIAYVHFKDCSKVIKALQKNERYELNGQVLDCSLADHDGSSIVNSSQTGYGAQTNQGQAQMLDDPGASNKVPPHNPDDEDLMEEVDLMGYEL